MLFTYSLNTGTILLMYTRFYLKPDGTARYLQGDERSHYGIAKTILGSVGDTEEAYAAMWNMGWIRVAESPDTVLAEIYRDGRAVPVSEITPAQRSWLEDKKYLDKKSVEYNSANFQSTREGMENSGDYARCLVDDLLR